MNNLKVRYLHLDEIETSVAELLRAFEATRKKIIEPPIPIDDIVEKHLKLTLELRDLEAFLGVPDALGAIWFDLGIVRLAKQLEEQEGRYCFTLSHEVGHWILHRPQIKAENSTPNLLQDLNPQPNIVCRTSEETARAEWQANQFAARLLIPTRFVRAATDACYKGPIFIEGLDTRRSDPVIVSQLSDAAANVISKGNFTNVSNEAMRYRLLDLGLVRDANRPQFDLF